jgi:hypothetical protein
MSANNDPSTGFAIFGLILWAVSGGAFEWLLFDLFGWKIAALPVLGYLCVLGYQIVWPPVSGSAGTGGSGTGVPYAVRIDPDDPDAGIPRRGA